MKKILLFAFGLGILSIFNLQAQNRLLYKSFNIGGSDTSRTEVLQLDTRVKIQSADKTASNPIPGSALSYTYLDYALDTAISQLYYSANEQYYNGYSIKSGNEYKEEGTEKVNGYNCKKYSIVLFSNKIELWFTNDLKFSASPTSSFADIPGVLVKYQRNGSATMQLASVKKDKNIKSIFPQTFGEQKSGRELNQLRKEKLILTTPIFNEDQICFNPKLEKNKAKVIDYDSVYHFANGTVILKKVKMDLLPEHYQIFAECTEYSNGDAYDRTGSIFIIPATQPMNMVRALIDSIGVLPYLTDKEGSHYQGIVKTDQYTPVVELIRFFTPFGVRHYNQYRSLDGQEWRDEVYYKQEITELRPLLSGDVYICAFIGNYDGGGHKLSLTLKAYPQAEEWAFDDEHEYQVESLFNTCNVMEMAGQNYGRLFGTDSLTVTFTVPENTTDLRLRYITTGHGGWDTGDEFVPKANNILIDGQLAFTYTPWRCDCGTYRTSNPASGNFWNGTSSSDYSRSGWCPGTATQPTYFDLSYLKPGTHTMTIAIPQGEPEGGSFSHWSVSGVLIKTVEK